jgi:hypothetical protein
MTTTKNITILTITETDGTTWTMEGTVRNGILSAKKGVKVNMSTLGSNVKVSSRIDTITTVSRGPRVARPDLSPIAAICFGKRSK